MLRLNVVGCGAVGTTLAAAWRASGHYTIQDVLTLSHATAARAVEFIGGGCAVESIASMQHADAWMVAVPDDALLQIVPALAERVDGASLVFHCSGSMSSQLLHGLQSGDKPPAVGSLHPLLGFSNPAAALLQLSDSFAAIEGEREAVRQLVAAASAIQLRPVPIDAARKTFYHAGCVFASNYLVTLLKIARDLLSYSGIEPDEALAMLKPLAEKNMANAFRLGPAEALTGPIVRGDVEVVERHIDALRMMFPECVDLYLNLAAHTVELAAEKRGD